MGNNVNGHALSCTVQSQCEILASTCGHHLTECSSETHTMMQNIVANLAFIICWDRMRAPPGEHLGPSVRPIRKPHQGWDLYAPVNTPVYPIADGMIVMTPRRHDLGRYVVLEFSHGSHKLYVVYAHLCHISVGSPQAVKEGTVLGQSGTDGNACGTPPHLHFEIRTIPDPPAHSGLHYRVVRA